MTFTSTKKLGFTLIELLVVVSIISLLSAIGAASLNSTRAKARNTRRMADLKTTMTALQQYFDTFEKFPANPRACCSWLEKAGWTQADTDATYVDRATFTGEWLHVLRLNGFWATPPTDPKPVTTTGWPNPFGYGYYLYAGGAGTSGATAIIGVPLEISPTTTGPFGSCRAITDTTNWCSGGSSSWYCLCAYDK